MNIFKKITQTEHEKLIEALEKHPVCKPMNRDLRESPTNTIWLNPSNQSCFNFGWFTYQDFYDWMDGKGKIVKGNTDEEKKKFWDVAVFTANHDMGWSFLYNKKFFHLIDNEFRPDIKSDGGFYRHLQTPLKITKTNHGEIISKIMGNVCRYYGDTVIEITANSHAYTRMHNELQGIKSALFALGVGYYGANNTPEDIENLPWIADICIYKAAYLYFVKNNIPLPDFDFVEKNHHKF